MLDVGLRGNWTVYNEFLIGFLWRTKKKYQHNESNMWMRHLLAVTCKYSVILRHLFRTGESQWCRDYEVWSVWFPEHPRVIRSIGADHARAKTGKSSESGRATGPALWSGSLALLDEWDTSHITQGERRRCQAITRWAILIREGHRCPIKLPEASLRSPRGNGMTCYILARWSVSLGSETAPDDDTGEHHNHQTIVPRASNVGMPGMEGIPILFIPPLCKIKLQNNIVRPVQQKCLTSTLDFRSSLCHQRVKRSYSRCKVWRGRPLDQIFTH